MLGCKWRKKRHITHTTINIGSQIPNLLDSENFINFSKVKSLSILLMQMDTMDRTIAFQFYDISWINCLTKLDADFLVNCFVIEYSRPWAAFFHCHSLSFGFRQWHCIFYLTSLLDTTLSLFLSLFGLSFLPFSEQATLLSDPLHWLACALALPDSQFQQHFMEIRPNQKIRIQIRNMHNKHLSENWRFW